MSRSKSRSILQFALEYRTKHTEMLDKPLDYEYFKLYHFEYDDKMNYLQKYSILCVVLICS